MFVDVDWQAPSRSTLNVASLLIGLQAGTQSGGSATACRLHYGGTSFDFNVTGTGLSYDGAGRLVSGTINTVDFYEGGVLIATVRAEGGLKLNASLIAGMMTVDDANALIASWQGRFDASGIANGFPTPQFSSLALGLGLSDTFVGSAFADQYSGLGGNDSIFGNGGADVLWGHYGNDRLFGGSGIDLLSGEAGDDILDGGAGADDLDGGDGHDTYVLGADVTDRLVDSSGVDTITSTISRSLAGYSMIERLTLLGSANINATGNSLANSLNGNAGNNILNGGAGADKLYGGAGNDTYVLGAENDLVSDASGANDTITTTISRSLASYAGIETLQLLGTANINATGDGAANTLIGNSGNNVLFGGGGADRLYGGLGNDIYDLRADMSDLISDGGGFDAILSTVSRSLAGYAAIERLVLTGSANINGTGNNLANTLQGNAGRNILDGAAGNDLVQGNGGADTLTGGAGADYFVYLTATDSNAAGFDVITDFKDSGADKIKLTDVYGGTLTFLGPAGAFTGIGQVRIAQVGADVNVAINLDANASTYEMLIRLSGTSVEQVSATDFLL